MLLFDYKIPVEADRALRDAYVALAFAFRRLEGSARSRDTELCSTLLKVRAEIERVLKAQDAAPAEALAAPSPSQEALREAASIISDLFASVRMGDPSRTFDYEWERRGLSWLAAQWARDPGTLINMWTADKVRSHHAALTQSAPVKAGG